MTSLPPVPRTAIPIFSRRAGSVEIPNGPAPPGGRKSVVIDETPALLLHIGTDFYAIEDVCTHDGQPLTDGPLNGCEITCPRHGARFDVRTGKPLCKPATEPVRTFEIEIRGNAVLARPRD